MSTREERFRRIDAAVFRTITAADWARSLRLARALPNRAREQIRGQILALNIGKERSESVEKKTL